MSSGPEATPSRSTSPFKGVAEALLAMSPCVPAISGLCSLSSGWGVIDEVATSSDPHRHDDVLETGLVGHGDEGAGVGVLKLDRHHFLAHVGERVDEVGDVEADLDRVAAVVDLELFHRLFLLGVARGDAQGAR